MRSPLHQLVLAMAMGNTRCTARFLKQVISQGTAFLEVLSGLLFSCSPPSRYNSKGFDIASSAARGANAFCRGMALDQSRRHFSLDPPLTGQ